MNDWFILRYQAYRSLVEIIKVNGDHFKGMQIWTVFHKKNVGSGTILN